MSILKVTDDLATQWCDDMLRLVAMVRETKPRDPLRAVENAVLDLRAKARRE